MAFLIDNSGDYMKKLLVLILIVGFIKFNNQDYMDLSNYQSKTIKVEVKGAVNHPGTYQLPYKANVALLIKKAGNYRKDADKETVNNAKILENEEVVVINTIKKIDKISINAASAEALTTLSGVGPSTAQKIIDYRNTQGPYKQIEDIKKVKGIKEKLFAKIKDFIKL